jgi:hypothetical protein
MPLVRLREGSSLIDRVAWYFERLIPEDVP